MPTPDERELINVLTRESDKHNNDAKMAQLDLLLIKLKEEQEMASQFESIDSLRNIEMRKVNDRFTKNLLSPSK